MLVLSLPGERKKIKHNQHCVLSRSIVRNGETVPCSYSVKWWNFPQTAVFLDIIRDIRNNFK